MNYIQAGDKKRPIHTGSYMLQQFCEANGLTLEQLTSDFSGTVGTTKRAVSFLYHSFLDGCRKGRIEPDFEEADVWDWIDTDPELPSRVYEAFAASMPAPQSSNGVAKKKPVKATR